MVAHFGLGDATTVSEICVRWPSGITQSLHDVAVNQALEIREPPRLRPVGPTSFEVQCWKGMAFAVEVSSDLKSWSQVGTVANVEDVLPRYQDAVPVHGTARFYRVVER